MPAKRSENILARSAVEKGRASRSLPATSASRKWVKVTNSDRTVAVRASRNILAYRLTLAQSFDDHAARFLRNECGHPRKDNQ
jgi:hypothetical protein